MAGKERGEWLPEPVDDGLFKAHVHEWSADKHHFLARYLDAFTTAMRPKPWSGLHYIDLFAGAGLECIEKDKTCQLGWGSPLIAAQTPRPFTKLHVCELDTEKCDALGIRLRKHKPDSQILNGDANVMVKDIIRQIPEGALSVAFLDPYGLHLHFDTLVTLAQRRIDLIIFFPDHLDALRNCEYVYQDNPNSNLDRVLGPGEDWRGALAASSKHRWGEVLWKMYARQICRLGYSGPELERISRRGNRPLYLLMYFSKSPKGLDIWRRVALLKPNAQRAFDFGGH